MVKLIYPDESYAINGACFNVCKDKGCGFLEPVYQECTEIELEFQNIPFAAQKRMKLTYRGRELKKTFKPDFICFDKIIVELKAVSHLIDEHRAQVINYLNATGCNNEKLLSQLNTRNDTKNSLLLFCVISCISWAT